ncbi:MAG: AMP-binding protein [Acidimicrobiia bacterium]|nr:AMP-binding protein [Acidimicrobiia bacterium]
MDILALHAANQPDKPALLQGDRVVTWSELVADRDRLANALVGRGLAVGERCAVYAYNSIEWLLATQAVGVAGAMSVPVNHRLTAEEALYVLDDSDAVVAFVGDAFLPIVEEIRGELPGVRLWVLLGDERRDWAVSLPDLLAEGAPEPVTLDGAPTGASMLYTAGTTGKPKGAVRGSVDPALGFGWMQALDLASGDHVHLVAGPLYHSAPGAFANMTFMVGGTVVVMPRFDAERALASIERYRCTSTFMAPTLLKRIVDLPAEVRSRHDVSSMRVIVVAGAPCPMRVKEQVIELFGPVLYEFYGSSELGINTILRPEDVLRKPGSAGKAAPGLELAVLDESGDPVPVGQPGELYVRRYEGMFEGYHKNEEATAEASRGDLVSVGDVAYLDDEGFVYICDRKRDMIISGGVNIYPAEIEDALHRHPDVEDVAVFGVPDDEWGERVHAAVQPRPGVELTADDVVAFAREHLAGYKVPREVSFHEDLPRDSAGKLVKRVLREPFWAGADRRI